jgi:hypothetical protein
MSLKAGFIKYLLYLLPEYMRMRQHVVISTMEIKIDYFD